MASDLIKPQVTDKEVIIDNPLDPYDLNENHWDYVIRRNQLLRGMDIDRAVPRRTFKQAFRWKADRAEDLKYPTFIGWDIAESSVTLTRSARVHSLVKSKFKKASASASYSFVSVSVEAERREKLATEEKQETVYIFSHLDYPHAIIRFDPTAIEPTPEFIQEVDKAFEKEGIERYRALTRVFKEYGQVYPIEVMLGGQLHDTDTKKLDEYTSERELEQKIKVGMSAKYGAFSGSAGFETGQKEKEQDSTVDEYRDKQFIATGGDTLLFEDAKKWAASVGPYKNWRVISLDHVVPIYKLLQDEKKIAQIDEMLIKYDPVGPILLPGQQATINESKIAETDGFVLANIISKPGWWNRGYIEACTDQNGDPKTVRAAASFSSTKAGAAIDQSSLIMPVKRNHHYVISNEKKIYCDVTPTVTFYPIADTKEGSFGDWEILHSPEVKENGSSKDPVLDPCQAETDGFLVCQHHFTYPPNGLTIEARVGEEETKETHKALAGLSTGWDTEEKWKFSMLGQGFCLPIRKDEFFTISKSAELGEPALKVFWLEMIDTRMYFGEREDRSISQIYTAETDGFLTARLKAEKDDTGWGKLHIFMEIDNDLPVRPATIQAHKRNGAGIEQNTLMVPIRVSQKYRVELSQQNKDKSDEFKVDLSWVPLRRLGF